MKILITWASWFIWRNLCISLKNKWFDIFWLIRENTKKDFFIDNWIHFFSYTNDIDCLDFFNFNRFDLVIHLSTLYLVTNNFKDIDNLIDSNIKFWTKILEFASLSWVKNFINTSSFIQNFENKDYSPVNLYAATKQAFEDIWKYYWESWKINFTSISLVNSYWPWDERRKIFNIWKDAIDNNEVVKSTSGEQHIDILYIDDVIDAYLKILDIIIAQWNDYINWVKYSISSWESMSLKELSYIFEKVVWKKLNIEWWAIPHRDREVMYPYNRGEKIPNWKPQVPFQEWIELFFWIK